MSSSLRSKRDTLPGSGEFSPRRKIISCEAWRERSCVKGSPHPAIPGASVRIPEVLFCWGIAAHSALISSAAERQTALSLSLGFSIFVL